MTEYRYEGREQALINKEKREQQNRGKVINVIPHPEMSKTWIIKYTEQC